MSGNERQLSILFADVTGSARLYEKLGNTEAAHAVDRCIKRIERAVESFNGHVLKVVGDEVMASFAAAEDAYQAAVEMLERVLDLPPVSGVKLGIRVGFKHGAVVEDNGIVFGPTVSAAARFAGLARAGQAVTCQETVARLPEWAQLATRRLDPVAVKGSTDDLELYELIWHTPETGTSTVVGSGPALDPAGANGLLRLVHGGNTFLIGDTRGKLTLGRDLGNDVVIRDRRASRAHARIEQREDTFVLIDGSTNGTFVTMDGGAEFFLRRGETVLRGSGKLSFAASSHSPEADIAEFQII